MNKIAAKKLVEARERRGYTQTQVADLLAEALSQTYSLRQYQKLEEGKFPKYKKEVVEKIDKILGSSIYELIYDQNVPRATLQNDFQTAQEQKTTSSYLEKRRAIKGNSEPALVPMVPVKAQAGYARSFNNNEYIDRLDLYPILPGIDPRGAIWRYFEVEGDSMEPKLFETDLVLVSMVPYEDWKEIKDGGIYVIVTDDDVLIKKIILKSEGAWILESLNKRHKQKPINPNDIKELWFYRRRITK